MMVTRSLTANESACAMPVARSTACCVDAFTSENAGIFHSAGDLISASVKSVTFNRDMLERKWPIEPYNAFLSRRSICDWFTGDARSRRRSDWYAASLVADMLKEQTCALTPAGILPSLLCRLDRTILESAGEGWQVSPLYVGPPSVEESPQSSRAWVEVYVEGANLLHVLHTTLGGRDPRPLMEIGPKFLSANVRLHALVSEHLRRVCTPLHIAGVQVVVFCTPCTYDARLTHIDAKTIASDA